MKSVMCFLEPTYANYIGWKMIEKGTLKVLWDSDSGDRNQESGVVQFSHKLSIGRVGRRATFLRQGIMDPQLINLIHTEVNLNPITKIHLINAYFTYVSYL